jgi:hypothetical protein
LYNLQPLVMSFQISITILLCLSKFVLLLISSFYRHMKNKTHLSRILQIVSSMRYSKLYGLFNGTQSYMDFSMTAGYARIESVICCNSCGNLFCTLISIWRLFQSILICSSIECRDVLKSLKLKGTLVQSKKMSLRIMYLLPIKL